MRGICDSAKPPKLPRVFHLTQAGRGVAIYLMRYLLLLALVSAGCSLHYTRPAKYDPFFAVPPAHGAEKLTLDLLRIDRSEYARGAFRESDALSAFAASGFAVHNPRSALLLRAESSIETPAEHSMFLRCLPLATLLIFPITQPRSFEGRYTLLDKRTGQVLKVYHRSSKDTEIVGWVTLFGILPALLLENVYSGEQRLEELSLESVLRETARDLKKDPDLRTRIMEAAEAELPPTPVQIVSIRDEDGRDLTAQYLPDLSRALEARNIEPGESGSRVTASLSKPFSVGAGGSHFRTQITAEITTDEGEKRVITFQVTFKREEIAEKLANIIHTLVFDTESRKPGALEL